MFLKEEEKNIITGILGTLAIHLVILIVFLIGRINKVHTKHQEQLVIEFDDQAFKTVQQQLEQKKTESKIQPLPQQDVHNIAVNTANKLEEKISTEKYIDQVKQELGIKDLNQQLDRSVGDEPIAPPDKKDETKPVRKAEFKGRTTTEVYLKDRHIRHQEIPVYKCEQGGKVVVDITVNPDGEVVNASIQSSSTNEECLRESALQAARQFLFDYKPDAEPRQKGTITFEFFSQ